MPQERHALQFVAKGFSVLPLYFPNKDGSCSCDALERTGKPCKSPGKHPVGTLAPSGVDDATRDVRVIAKWFQSQRRLNLGVACGQVANGRRLVVFDIDNTEIARAVLDPELGLPDETAVAGTGKGCHVYLYTNVDVQTHNLYLADKDHKTGKVGEIRCTGSFVAAPPSKHFSGVRYRWYGQPEEDDSIPYIQLVADVDKFATYICGKAGYQLEPPFITTGELPEGAGPIEPIDLPFTYDPLEHQVLWQYMSGTFPADGDRSLTLFNIAREIRDVAVALGETITGEQLQGVIKRLDQTKYHKYTSNARYKDPDKEYRRIVWGPKGVLRENAKSVYPSTAPIIAKTERRETSVYGWHEQLSKLIKYGVKEDQTLANCRPVIEEVLEIDNGEKTTAAYNIAFIRATGSISWQVTPSIFADPRKLREQFAERVTQTDFNVYPDGWKHIEAAARELCPEAPRRRVYQHTGWIDSHEGRAFVLPGASGAITEDNIDHDLAYNYDPEDHVSEKLSRYGVNVRPAVTDTDIERAQKALITLMECAPPEITIPILVQVVSGPLASHGMMADPPLMHVMGRTGSMKTSLATAVLSVFGEFDRTTVPETWVSTVNVLQSALYAAKDLTLLVDDYKASTAPKVTSIIQAYSDRVGRSRMGRDQKVQTVQRPRGLLLSTGEDVWSTDESATARTIRIDMHQGMIDTAKLTRLQEKYIPQGWLQLVGGTYIAWLIGCGNEELTELYARFRRNKLKKLQQAADDSTHQRMIGLLASLVTSGDIFRKFLRQTMPDAYEVYTDLSRLAWVDRMKALHEQGEEAREQGPYNRLITTLRQCTLTREVRLVKVGDNNESIGGGTSARIVGYFDEDNIYLSEATTWHWFAERYRQQGETAPTNWQSIMKDAEATIQGAHRKQVVALRRARFLSIPRKIADVGANVQTDLADFVRDQD